MDVLDQVRAHVAALRAETRARAVLAIDGAGLLAVDGDVDRIDEASLARRVADRMSALGSLGRLLRERGLQVHDEEQGVNVHARAIGRRLVLIAIYDATTSTGIVALAARRAAAVLEPLVRSDPRLAELPDEDDPDGEP